MIEECKYNYNNKYNNNLKCNVCKINDCTQKHLLECPVLIVGNKLVTYIPLYEDIFSDNLSKQSYIAKIMMENIRRKNELDAQ